MLTTGHIKQLTFVVIKNIKMKNIETSILINSSQDNVWDMLMDFNNFSDWNPFIKRIQGTPIRGNEIEVLLNLNNKTMTFKPVVLKNEKSTEFRWKGKMFVKGLFDGEHYFQLKTTPKGTLFIHGEKFTGLLSWILFKMIGKKTREGFISMNEALKSQSEMKN
jgi:hypothetical protein